MKKYRKEHNCLNCGANVEAKFCPQCGQENIETREPFLGFLIHSIGHYFHFDSKFQKSFIPLITQPGKLTNEFIAGRRASHIPPVTMYLFISLVFFLLLGIHKTDINAAKTVTNPQIIQTQIDSLKKIDITKLSSKEKTALRQKISGLNELQQNLGKVQKEPGNMLFNIDGDSTQFTSIAKYESYQASLPPAKRAGWFTDYFVKKSILLQQKYGDELLDKIIETVQYQLPKMMFILMPLFALILSLSFYRSKLYFIEHLIYTLHVHSFLFLLYILIELITDVWKSAEGTAISISLLINIWYIYRSMRTVYKKGRVHTLLKFMLLSFVYLILLSISFLSILLFSVATL